MSGIFSDEDAAENKEYLSDDLQKTWLALGHALTAGEHLFAYTNILTEDTCEGIPGQLAWGFPNPWHYTCRWSKFAWNAIAYALLVATNIAFRVIDGRFTVATRGPNQEMYSYYYSRAMYRNTKEHNEWNVKALGTLRQNMKDQVKQLRYRTLFHLLQVRLILSAHSFFRQAHANESTATTASHGNSKSRRRRYNHSLCLQFYFQTPCLIS